MPDEPTRDHFEKPTPPSPSSEEPSLPEWNFETSSFELRSAPPGAIFEVEPTPRASSFAGEPTPAESASSEAAIPWIGGEPELEPVPRTDMAIGSPPPVRRSVLPWWALLILLVGLVAGWGIGKLPARTAKPASTSAAIGTAPPESSVTRAESEPAEKPKEPEFSQWTSLQIAMVESDLNQKPILIDFSAAWCGPCSLMKEQVFDDQVLAPAVQAAVIPVSIVDRVREDGRNPTEIQNLQRNFEIQAFPTLVVFFPATGKALKSQGFKGPEATVEWITQAAESVR